ncbi:energy transducer TonB [Piscinibacter defluvii]|uniref:energy transducer TonB n=1 Tax=Piscinibacter defluvii TaxID=1796922 RepID=UPI000FDEC76B|nr:energy transducer TonB [Piscinibacter defluvii]
MSRLLIAAAALALPALAQPAPEPGERTQRAADNPFRMIIEAAKIKSRKAGGDKPAAKAAPAIPAAPPAPAVVARPPLPPAEPAPEAADDAPPVPLVVVAPPPREQPESTVVTVEAAPVPLPPVAGPDGEPEAPPPAPALPPLRLLEVVEPVTPRALIGQLRGEVRAQVSFTVAPDGLVREPRVDSISHPLMTSSVLQAVRQWRYQAIPEPRAHGVEIVLRQD